MKLSDQRLDEILNRLLLAQDISGVSLEELKSLASELRQLRLRTSSHSRGAAAAPSSSGTEH